MAARKRHKPDGHLARDLQENFESFSKSRKSIARYLIDHLAEAPVLSAQELARRTSTTSSTVVRFAQHLGFSGFTEMMKAAWDEHRLTAGKSSAGIEGQLRFPVDDDFSGRAVRTDMLILEETIKRNRADDFLDIVELLEKAEAVYAAGLYEAAMVVDYLGYYLTVMGVPVVAITSSSEESVARLAELDDKAVLVAIGFGTAHQFLLRVIRAARGMGAETVGISENQISEVAKLTDRNLFCYRDSTSFAPSLVGAFSIANAIISALYARNRRAYDARISRLRNLPLTSDWL